MNPVAPPAAKPEFIGICGECMCTACGVRSNLQPCWRSRCCSAEARAQTAVTFSLDSAALGRHAAWYVALERATRAGLDVTIIPSQGIAQALQSVESKAAQFAFSDVAGLVPPRRQADRDDGRADLSEGADAIFALAPAPTSQARAV